MVTLTNDYCHGNPAKGRRNTYLFYQQFNIVATVVNTQHSKDGVLQNRSSGVVHVIVKCKFYRSLLSAMHAKPWEAKVTLERFYWKKTEVLKGNLKGLIYTCV